MRKFWTWLWRWIDAPMGDYMAQWSRFQAKMHAETKAGPAIHHDLDTPASRDAVAELTRRD